MQRRRYSWCTWLVVISLLIISFNTTNANSSSKQQTTSNLAPIPVFVDWSQAGYPGMIPELNSPIINIKEMGASGDGISNDSDIIQNTIDSISGPAVVFLPEGTYRIESAITLRSGIIVRGEGYRQTRIDCASSTGCFNITGSIGGSFVNIQSGLARGSTQITVTDATGFSIGMGAQIQQADIVPASASWGENAVGQMVKILAVDGNTLTINPPLHIEYKLDKNPQIRPIHYIQQVGIEDLLLKRLDTGGDGSSNFNIRRAADCWFRRIESDWTEKYHFAVSESLHLEIRDSYIHDAHSKSGGGEGYGVSLARHTTSVLTENNIFNELRHAMIIQIGTSGSVFGYNYAQRNYSDDGWDKSYISLHGHYPFLNLFEGNIVGWAYMGDYWGDIGPDNTLFRNWVIGTDKHEDFGSSRGIALQYFHGPQYVVGNEISSNDGIYFSSDSTGNLEDVIIHGNNVQGTITWDPTIPDHTLPNSYYLDSKPAFYGTVEWPSIGSDQILGQSTIPALERWKNGDYVSASTSLHLSAIPRDRAILLNWTVSADLPMTSTWQLNYKGPIGDEKSPITNISNSTRSYILTGTTNYIPYEISINAMLNTTPIMTDTISTMSTDISVYLPMLLREK